MRGDTIVFTRPLGIKRNAVVLPAGYELVTSTSRRRCCRSRTAASASASGTRRRPRRRSRCVRARADARGRARGRPRSRARLGERAHQNREIVYFLQQPETHAFDLYHDYTESRARHEHVPEHRARGQPRVEAAARNLDTGEPLRVGDRCRATAITRAKLEARPDVTPETEVVVFRFPAVQGGAVDAAPDVRDVHRQRRAIGLVGDELVWDRSFGRPANAVVLPAGWMLTNSSMPGDGERAARRAHAPRLREPAARRAGGADHRAPSPARLTAPGTSASHVRRATSAIARWATASSGMPRVRTTSTNGARPGG